MQPPAQPDASTAPDRQPQNQRLTESALARALGVSRQAINDLVKVGIVRNQTDWMIDILTDADTTGVVVVTVPEEMPVGNGERSVAKLNASHVLGLAQARRELPAWREFLGVR